MGRRRSHREAVRAQVDLGVAELLPDLDRPSGWMLLVDGTAQSYVDVADPTNLEFDYVRRIGSVLDTAAAPGEPLRVLHLGGGGLTLPRYLAATRPGSVQRVVECDAALTRLVRRVLPLPRGTDLRIRAVDARTAVEASAPGRFDVVITDVYLGSRMPGFLATVEFAAQVVRVLRRGGRYAVNITDGPPLDFARRQVATLRTAFTDVCLIAEPGVLRRRRFGNLVLVGAAPGGRLPVADLATAAARDMFPARLLHGRDLERFAAGARPVSDVAAMDSPEPPAALFG